MKKFNYLLFCLLALGTLTFISCGDDEKESTELNIVENASETDNLSTLAEAIEQADLASILEGDGPFTVFAPTNAAFQDLLDSNPDWNELSDIDNTTLAGVLAFHVISGSVRAGDLANGYQPTLATGPNEESLSLQINVDGGVTFNGEAAPVTTDIIANNGVIHIIDKVMLAPNVVGLASNNDDFSSLVAALTRSDLTADFVGVLSGNGPFTVFAPTNAAFQRLLDSNDDWNALADIPVATLEAVLNYHVVNGANVQSDELSDDQEITTLGGVVTVDLSDGAKLETSSGESVVISATNVQGTNGVIHAIDNVLIP